VGGDPFGIDTGFGCLGLGAGQYHLAIPAFGVDDAPRPEIQAGRVLRLRVRKSIR
jgi:hypothetical protein